VGNTLYYTSLVSALNRAFLSIWLRIFATTSS